MSIPPLQPPPEPGRYPTWDIYKEVCYKWMYDAYRMISENFVVTVTDTYSIPSTGQTVVCNKPIAFVVTLPIANEIGKKLFIKNIGVGVVTVEGNGTDTIDGAPNMTLLQWGAVALQCYATGKWVILAQ